MKYDEKKLKEVIILLSEGSLEMAFEEAQSAFSYSSFEDSSLVEYQNLFLLLRGRYKGFKKSQIQGVINQKEKIEQKAILSRDLLNLVTELLRKIKSNNNQYNFDNLKRTSDSIEIKLGKAIEDYSAEELENLLSSLVSLLKINNTELVIRTILPGSISVIIDLPKGMEDKLVSLYEGGLLSHFSVSGIKINPIIDFDIEVPDFKNRLQILPVPVDYFGNENIAFVPEKAAAGYVRGFSERGYIRELESFRLPWLPIGETFRAFEISGDSMLPIQPRSIVLAAYVERFDILKFGERYIIITNDGIVFKRLYKEIDGNGLSKLVLTSDNPLYAPYSIEFSDVREIWRFYLHISEGN